MAEQQVNNFNNYGYLDVRIDSRWAELSHYISADQYNKLKRDIIRAAAARGINLSKHLYTGNDANGTVDIDTICPDIVSGQEVSVQDLVKLRSLTKNLVLYTTGVEDDPDNPGEKKLKTVNGKFDSTYDFLNENVISKPLAALYNEVRQVVVDMKNGAPCVECSTSCKTGCGSTCYSSCFIQCGADNCKNACAGSSACSNSCTTSCHNETCASECEATCGNGACKQRCSAACGKDACGVNACTITCGQTCHTDSCMNTCLTLCGRASDCNESCANLSSASHECAALSCSISCYDECSSQCNNNTCLNFCITGNCDSGCQNSNCSDECTTVKCANSCVKETDSSCSVQGCELNCAKACIVGNCNTSCSDSCNDTCYAYCGADCQKACRSDDCTIACGRNTCVQNCVASCSEVTCKTDCDTGCGTSATCSDSCKASCSKSTCERDCNTECIANACSTGCGEACSGTCESQCYSECGGVACKNKCADSCLAACSGESCSITCSVDCTNTCYLTCGEYCGNQDCSGTCLSTCRFGCDTNSCKGMVTKSLTCKTVIDTQKNKEPPHTIDEKHQEYVDGNNDYLQYADSTCENKVGYDKKYPNNEYDQSLATTPNALNTEQYSGSENRDYEDAKAFSYGKASIVNSAGNTEKDEANPLEPARFFTERTKVNGEIVSSQVKPVSNNVVRTPDNFHNSSGELTVDVIQPSAPVSTDAENSTYDQNNA